MSGGAYSYLDIGVMMVPLRHPAVNGQSMGLPECPGNAYCP